MESLPNDYITPKTLWTGCGTKLLGSMQDYAFCGSNELFDWMLILDGHGKGNVVTILSQLLWDHILHEFENPDDLLNHINEHLIYNKVGGLQNNFHDGSTCSIVKIYKPSVSGTRRVVIHWIGDSTIGIKINSKFHFTQNHDLSHQNDMEYIKTNNIKMTHAWSPKILDMERNITMVNGKYFHYNYIYDENNTILSKNRITKPDMIAMTRVLGHNHGDTFATPQQFDTMELSFNESDTVTILNATDGLWDVLPKNCEDILIQVENAYVTKHNPVEFLLNKAEELWNTNWNYYVPPPWDNSDSNPIKQCLGYPDDVGVTVYCY
jgi:serine/threonine protein phosphatase PrpC